MNGNVTRQLAWYFGVILAACMLGLSFLMRSSALTIGAACLIWVLKRNSHIATLPKIYQDKGVTEEMISGQIVNKKN